MALIPVPEEELKAGEVLVLGASEIETIVASVAVERAMERPVKRLFLPTFELWRLAEIPAYRHGSARTCVLGFPSPALDQQPELVRKALREADDLVWISEHPIDGAEVEAVAGVTAIAPTEGDLWSALSQTLQLESDPAGLDEDLQGIMAELPEHLPDPEEAGPTLSWRYALEAARQDPFTLRLNSQGLVDGEGPEAGLVETGYGLILECRDLARTSSFPTFETPAGSGVIVMAPRSAFGFYRDVARDARRHRGGVVSLLAFDSQEPAIVDYERRPSDLSARLELLCAAFPSHAIREFGRAGIVIKGSGTGELELLTALLEILEREIN